jgi:hypothetical protein
MTTSRPQAAVTHKMTAATIRRFNAAMTRLGLGARVVLKGDRISLKELQRGSGMKAMNTLNGLPDDHPHAWCRPFLEDLMLALLEDIKAKKTS